MSDEDDEEALTWAGTRDPSSYEAPAPKPTKATRTAKSAVAASADGAEESEDEDDGGRPSLSAGMLVALGVLGGIYALYTIGWFVSWQRLIYIDTDGLELTAFRVQQVFAIVVAPGWFAAALYFTRGRKQAARLLWLILGALALIPWSFVLGR